MFQTAHEFENRRCQVYLEEIWTDIWVFILEQSDVVQSEHCQLHKSSLPQVLGESSHSSQEQGGLGPGFQDRGVDS